MIYKNIIYLHILVNGHIVNGKCECKDKWKGPLCNEFVGCPTGFTIRDRVYVFFVVFDFRQQILINYSFFSFPSDVLQIVAIMMEFYQLVHTESNAVVMLLGMGNGAKD